MTLQMIQDTVQQAAFAITAAIELETEIVDETLMIIGGTGRYHEKIGTYEENGQLDSSLVYATCLRESHEYINFNPSQDSNYDAMEHEMGEICCPIRLKDKAVGLIGLVALNESQRQLLMSKVNEFTSFLRSMAELIAGKYEAELNNISLQDKIASFLPGDSDTSFDNIIGVSPEMTLVKQRALQISGSDSTVLITGESGTGKDLLARAIHTESPRRENPFISINCAAIPETLLESELFGYVKGSFTGAEKSGKLGKFQLAEGGTIFLDEIGDMPLHLQAKLLTALQNHQIDPIGSAAPVNIDVRVIAATNKNLEEMIKDNQFREDLYFRLNVIPINIPPLRVRTPDIELLLNYTIDKYASKLGKPVRFMDVSVMARLMNYSWPGNVREMENVIEYAINMAKTNTIHLTDLPERITERKTTSPSAPAKIAPRIGTLSDQLAVSEQEIIAAALDHYGWSLEGKRQAAQALDISLSTLYRKLRSTKK